jgi:hypothetical protein
MKTYTVTLKTDNGAVSTFSINGNTPQEALKLAQAGYHPVAAGNVEYMVQEQASAHLPPDAMQGLYSATGALMGCVIAFVVAEYKLRKWLKG